MSRLLVGSTNSADTSLLPVNSVLDAFTRADSATTIGSSWSTLFKSGLSNQGISSNQLYNPQGSFSNYTAMYWNAGTFTADQEAYMTITTKGSENANDNPAVFCRITSPGALFNGYGFTYYDGNGGCFITKITAGVATQISSTVLISIASGNKLRLECLGSTLRGYVWNGTAWGLKVTVVDTTYSAAGYIGFYIPGNTQDGRFDDFGGGSIAGVVVPARTASGARLAAGARTAVV